MWNALDSESPDRRIHIHQSRILALFAHFGSALHVFTFYVWPVAQLMNTFQLINSNRFHHHTNNYYSKFNTVDKWIRVQFNMKSTLIAMKHQIIIHDYWWLWCDISFVSVWLLRPKSSHYYVLDPMELYLRVQLIVILDGWYSKRIANAGRKIWNPLQ